jgi:hypothetical protein
MCVVVPRASWQGRPLRSPVASLWPWRGNRHRAFPHQWGDFRSPQTPSTQHPVVCSGKAEGACLPLGTQPPPARQGSVPGAARQPGHRAAKAKFILATDGETLEAEDLSSRRDHRLRLPDFPDHFGFFLPLAGITTVKQIRESSFDIRATSRLNKLYVELLKDNPEWGTPSAARHEPLHGAADLLLLRRGHRHLQRRPACSPPPSSR